MSMRHQNEGKGDHCHHLTNTSLGSARLIVISGWGDTARSLRTGHHHQDDDHGGSIKQGVEVWELMPKLLAKSIAGTLR